MASTVSDHLLMPRLTQLRDSAPLCCLIVLLANHMDSGNLNRLPVNPGVAAKEELDALRLKRLHVADITKDTGSDDLRVLPPIVNQLSLAFHIHPYSLQLTIHLRRDSHEVDRN